MNAPIDSLVPDALDIIILVYLRDYLPLIRFVSKRWATRYVTQTLVMGKLRQQFSLMMVKMGHAHVGLWAYNRRCPIKRYVLEENLSDMTLSNASNGTAGDVEDLVRLHSLVVCSRKLRITLKAFDAAIWRVGPKLLDLMGIPEFSDVHTNLSTIFLTALWNEDTDTVRASQVMWKHVLPPDSYFVIAARMNRPEFMAALDKKTLESCKTHLLNAYKVALEHKSSDFVRWLDANDYAPSYSEVRHLWEKIGWNLDGVQESG